jgi:2-keto-4-pentenoate hydratase/2-oxohepta-3-ene-1,7-dioic acid hydratase in catechol pathway
VRAVRFSAGGGEPRLGRLEDDRVVDGGPAPAIGFDASPEAWEAIAAASGPVTPVEAVTLLHPTVPRKLIGIGLNYRDHAAESELALPDVPVIFAKFTSAMVGHGATIVVPREETRPDYEGEVAVVIGRRTYRADAAAARQAVGGISAMNDVSGRRAQLETPLRQFTLGKSFDSFAPMGPCVASADGVDLESIGIRTAVSGEVMQDSNTRNLIFSIVELIAYCSAGMTLEPGDVIATGTPSGVGNARTPPRYLRAGDAVEITVDGVGTLRNSVEIEP